jgi:hypothetical protein
MHPHRLCIIVALAALALTACSSTPAMPGSGSTATIPATHSAPAKPRPSHGAKQSKAHSAPASTVIVASQLRHAGWLPGAASVSLEVIFDPVANWEEQGTAPNDGWNHINMSMLVPAGLVPGASDDTFQAWGSEKVPGVTVWADNSGSVSDAPAELLAVDVGGFTLYSSVPQSASWHFWQISRLARALRVAFRRNSARSQYPLDQYPLVDFTPSLPSPGGFVFAVLGPA